jgi:hypothetical protein
MTTGKKFISSRATSSSAVMHTEWAANYSRRRPTRAGRLGFVTARSSRKPAVCCWKFTTTTSARRNSRLKLIMTAQDNSAPRQCRRPKAESTKALSSCLLHPRPTRCSRPKASIRQDKETSWRIIKTTRARTSCTSLFRGHRHAMCPTALFACGNVCCRSPGRFANCLGTHSFVAVGTHHRQLSNE